MRVSSLTRSLEVTCSICLAEETEQREDYARHVVHTYNPSIQEAEVRGSQVQGQPRLYRVQGQPGLYREALFQKQTKQNKKSQVSVAHACNCSYSERKDQEDQSLKPAQANSLRDPIWKIRKTKKT
jgi:pullulanase/glycogen debranching enzyme